MEFNHDMGTYNYINNTSNSENFATYNFLQGSSTRPQTAVFNLISNSTNATQYAVRNFLGGAGSTGSQYGVYNEFSIISNTAQTGISNNNN